MASRSPSRAHCKAKQVPACSHALTLSGVLTSSRFQPSKTTDRVGPRFFILTGSLAAPDRFSSESVFFEYRRAQLRRMPVVSIVELGREPAESDPSADGTPCHVNRIFSVTNHTAKHGSRQQQFKIPSTPLGLMDDICWYLEDFALRCPLETKRADRVKHSLRGVGRTLVNSIHWASIVGHEERKESLLLSIQEQPCGFAPVVWELLEDSELWDDPFKGGVFVSRCIQKPEGTSTAAAAHGKRPETASPSLNILIVAARPRKEQDIPHRIVSKILYDKIRRQSDQLTSPTYLKILRPPTWEEFNRELEEKGVGFYDIVHFDVHGLKMDDNRYVPAHMI